MKAGGVTFTIGEAIRYGVIKGLLEKRMENTEAALALDLSIRQAQRIKKKGFSSGMVFYIFGSGQNRQP